ncbi:DUF3048 domain-containing protein (plasmid) [Rossellomorea sp. AcN35-11]|nr:DUF3048 domain-containing protein [Rossellomorea aquimaris]WJV32330.1 DUF3048 domain-containing protein [Rossellomorea sp. AcN35-11]
MKRIIALLMLFSFLLLSACSNDDDQLTTTTEEHKTNEEHSDESTSSQVKEIKKLKSITTGEELPEEFHTNPFTIMIENSPSARPHSGLAEADIVYEFEVEGRITRFLAVFHDQFPEMIGPVRSSRHYYLPIAESYNIPYVHYGGSSYAYEELKRISIPNYDGMTQSKAFKRDSTRKAPHNAYFHPYPDSLDNYGDDIESQFSFNEGEEIGEILKVSYVYNNFTDIEYVFDKDSTRYTRYLEGKKHEDRNTGKAIEVRNILFLTAKHSPIPGDSSGRINVDTKGAGELTLYTNGQEIKGTWEYKDGTYRYYDDGANELNLNPGTTWVQFIRDMDEVISY